MNATQPADGPPGSALPPGKADHGETAGSAGATRPDGARAEAANDSMLDSAQALWREFSGLAKDHLELALLETQRAGKSAVNMLVYAIGAGLLLVTAWLASLAALVIGLAELGLHPGFGMLLVVALNLIAAFVLYRMIRANGANLRFPATVRSLKSDVAALRGEPTP